MVRTCFSVFGSAFRALHHARESAYKNGLFECYKSLTPVISVGNLTTGGTGKTPMVIWLAERLCSLGLKPAVVSRGYGGSNKREYLIVSDGSGGNPLHDASTVGDEPYLIACRIPQVPVLIGRKRIHPIHAVQELFSVDVIILDDGFQHLSVSRELDIVLLTGREHEMIPFVQLREPISSLRRANLLLLDSTGDCQFPHWLTKYDPVFLFHRRALGLLTGSSVSELVDTSYLVNKEVTLVSAIARPERFLDTASALGWKIVKHITRRDHYFFSGRELEELLSHHSPGELVFTEKDWVKLPAWFQSHKRTWALRIDVQMEQDEAFLKLVAQKIHCKTA